MLTHSISIPALPNFLIIGAAKSGTTSLYHYLRQHPQVYLSPVKEPAFLAFGESDPHFDGPGDMQLISITNLEDYQKLFTGGAHKKAIGEASVVYLYNPQTPERIRQIIPHAKLIAILRQPAERAFSHFLMNVRNGPEHLSDFSEALRAEPERKRQNWHPHWFYRERGYYYRQLSRYYAMFPVEHIQIFLYEDLQNSPLELMRAIFRFLEVDDTFTPDVGRKHNRGGKFPRNRYLLAYLRSHSLKNFFKQVLHPALYQNLSKYVLNGLLKKTQLSPELRAELTDGYREDILSLQKLIGRDLTSWLH